MKRTGFKQKARKPMARVSSNPANVKLREKKKTEKKGVGLPAWIKAIPESQAHGSGTLQKRLWRLKSDFVRIRDWYTWGSSCVATGNKLGAWREGQAGHFIAYSKCNGMYKFNEANIHLQSAKSNSWGDRDDWNAYERELVRRYGEEFVPMIERSNRDWPLKITNEMVILEIQRTLKLLGMLPEQPDYYPRVMQLLTSQTPESS